MVLLCCPHGVLQWIWLVLVVKLHFCKCRSSWSSQPMLSPCNGILSLVKTELGRAWKEHFLWKGGYSALLSRLLIESFKLKLKLYIFLPEFKFSIQRSPHFFFSTSLSANCSSCLFTARLSFAIFQQQRWCVVMVLSTSHTAGLWFREGFSPQNWHCFPQSMNCQEWGSCWRTPGLQGS